MNRLSSSAAGRRRPLSYPKSSGKLQSNLWDDASDEASYDSKTVDDWGVNRDMQQSYKYVRHPKQIMSSQMCQEEASITCPLHRVSVLGLKQSAGSRNGQDAPVRVLYRPRSVLITDIIVLLIRAPQDKEFEACKASAAGSLAFRPHSRSELATKLVDKGYDKATIDRALSRLQELVRIIPLAWAK